MAPIVNVPNGLLHARQDSSSTGNDCPSTISSGGIAGIVIGTIAGTLLILWLLRVCSLPGARGGGQPDWGYTSGGGTETRHRHRRRRSSPSYYEYTEKPRSVRRPAKVYLT